MVELPGSGPRRALADGPWPAWLTVAAAFAGYSALALVVTFPLIWHLSSRLPKDLGDPLLVTSILWWNAHVLPLTERWWSGFGFFPATGMVAFSDHFLGAALIASPLQWLGFSPITAYNLTFLASYPLCAGAAHALAYTLTRRHDAAVVCGLAYGFNPYRVAHVEHLELLLSFGMPAALAALHLYAASRRARWLAVFAAALTIQALSASYYALFFTVFLGLWVIWFVRPRAWRDLLAIGAAAGVAALAVLPIALGYSRIHQDYNMTRDFSEVLNHSADVSSFVTASPLSALWGWTAPLNGGERQLFPGFTIVALALAAAIVWRRSGAKHRDGLAHGAKWLWGAAIAFAAVAMWARIVGPWQLDWGWGLRISVSTPYKPLSLAVVAAMGAVALGPTFRAAWQRRSAIVFYLAAAALLFLCSLGPRPTLLGEQVLYEPPYAWLMRLPYFGDTVRVPARFAMLAILALSVTAGLAFHRFASLTRHRAVLLLVVAAGIVADGWIRALPLPVVPQRSFQIPASERPAAVMELPLGDVWRDSAAMYRVTTHQTPAVNGYNGYEPSYYQVLRRALETRDETILDELAAFGPMLIAIDNRVEAEKPWAEFLLDDPDIRPLRGGAGWALFRLPFERRRPPQGGCEGNPLPIAAASDSLGPVDTAVLTDDDPATRWITADAQRAGDMLVVDLGRHQPVCGLEVSMGAAAVLYPGTLSVATSVDNRAWTAGFTGALGGSAFRAALEHPPDARLAIPLRETVARFVRLRIEKTDATYPWAVSDLVVQAPRQREPK
jgi:hypothetical protein